MEKYNKTQWIKNETLVSADNLNKIENQLEALTYESINLSSQLDTSVKFKVIGEDTSVPPISVSGSGGNSTSGAYILNNANNNTIQLYIDKEKEIKGYPITSPDRVIDENGVSVKDLLNELKEQVGNCDGGANLKNEMFYYFNREDIKLKNKDSQLAAISISTSVQTNLMCHVTINPLIEIEGLLKIRMTINNKDIQFSPLIDLEQGYRMVSFSIPFIAVEGGQTKVIELRGEFNGSGLIPTNCLHFSITGENISASLAQEPPHAEVEEIYKFEEYTFKKYDGNDSTNVEIIISKPNTIICKEIKNFDKAENLEENLKTKDKVNYIKK